MTNPMKKASLLLFLLLITAMPCLLAQQPSATITGVIRLSGTNLPQQYVNIAVKGTTNGTTTAADGSYELKIPANSKNTILFSFIGYETDSVTLLLKTGEHQQLNRTLRSVSTQLESIEVKDQQVRTSSFSRLDPKIITFINIYP